MSIYFGGVRYDGVYAGGHEIAKGYAAGSEVFASGPTQIGAFGIQAATVFGNANYRGFVAGRSEGSTTGTPSYETTAGVTVAVNGLFSFAPATRSRISVTSGTAVGDLPDRIMAQSVVSGSTRTVVMDRNDGTFAQRGLGAQCDYDRIAAGSTHDARQVFTAATVNVTLLRL